MEAWGPPRSVGRGDLSLHLPDLECKLSSSRRCWVPLGRGLQLGAAPVSTLLEQPALPPAPACPTELAAFAGASFFRG